MVIAVSLSSKVVDQDNDAISDRRYRWELSEDSDEPANDDSDGSVDASDIIISDSIEYRPASSKSNESGSTEA